MPSIHRLIVASLAVSSGGSAIAQNVYDGVPPGLEEAYQSQDERVSRRIETTAGEGVAGFKGGLTNANSQKALGISQPVYGVLYRSGSTRATTGVSRSSFGQLYIETEIGFVVGRRIVSQQRDEASLRKNIEAIVPVVELPDATRSATPGSQAQSLPTVTEMVANNLGASHFIQGAAHSLKDVNPDVVAVKLHRDGALINHGSGSEVQNGQWATLLTLVNRIVARRGSIDAKTLIITGSLGTPQPGQTGRYRADFGELGTLEFDIAP